MKNFQTKTLPVPHQRCSSATYSGGDRNFPRHHGALT